MKRKIIFFDIDGTLLSEITWKVPESAIEAIHKAQKNGHIAVVNTGRTKAFVEKEILDIGFDAYVCGCGTKIIYHDEELFHQTIVEDKARRIIETLRKCKIDGVLEGDKQMYFDVRERIYSERWKKFYDKFCERTGSWEDAEISMDKLYVLTNENSDIVTFKKELSGDFDFIDRENGFWELVPCGISKASGIRMLAEKLGIAIEDTISIGDSNNDLAMLETTGISIAMGKHSAEIHDKVDFITKTVEEDGIYHALSHYGLI